MGKEAKYVVRLTMEERGTLESLVAEGRAAADRLLRARMLLKSNIGQGGPGWSDEKIAAAFEAGPSTIHRLRQRLLEDGFEAALVRKPKSRHRAPKLDGEKEARLVALDYAHVIRALVDVHYAAAEKVVLVQDNLNTHKPASLYEAFPAEEARRLEDRKILTSEIAAWETDRNNLQCQVHWQFTTADARTKLWRLYPVIEPVNN